MNRSTLDKLKALLLGSRRRRGGCRIKNPSKLSNRQPDQESVVCISEEDEKFWELVMVDPLLPTQISEKACQQKPSYAVLSEKVDVPNLCMFGTCGHSCVAVSCEESEKSSEGTEFTSLESFEEDRRCGSLDDVDSDDSGGSGTAAYSVRLQESARKLIDTADLPPLHIPCTCLPDGVNAQDIATFRENYQNHCEAILESAVKFTLGHIKSLWVNFWEGLETDLFHPGRVDSNKPLSLREKIFFLCELKQVQEYVSAVDMRIYQKIVETLVPDLWIPVPEKVAEEIWKFATRFEGWMNVAMEGYSSEICSVKSSAVAAFSRELQNSITLNQLAKKLSLVLQNKEQTNQMLEDFSRLNFRSLEEEASWFCGPNQSLFMGVKRVVEDCLFESLTMQQWAARVEGVCNRMLPRNSLCGGPQLFEAVREVVLENLFYTELIMQAIDVGDKKSVVSLALLLKVYNGYVYYLSKQRLAQAVGVLPVVVMTKDFVNAMSSEGRSQTEEDGYSDTSTVIVKSSCSTSGLQEDKKVRPENASSPAGPQIAEASSFTPRSARRWQMHRFSPDDNVKGRQCVLQGSPVSQQLGTPPFLLSRCPW